jgi:diacylglycerol kinase (ATP)
VGFVPIEVRVEFIEPVLPPLEAKVLLAAALNSPTYGGGLKLAPEATLGDGFLHIVMVEEIGTLGILQLLPRLISSGELRTDRVQRRRARKIRLTTTKPRAFHGDGEILGSTPVEIELVSGAVQVLAPALS